MIKWIKNNKFVIWIFLIALVVRVFTVLVLHYALSPEMQNKIISPDAHCSESALEILDSWRGKYELTKIANHAYHSYVAAIYNIFGYHLIIAQVLNSLLGALAIFFLYSIAKKLFNRQIAYISIVLYAFFPSLVLWSSQNLKEIPILFVIIVSIWIIQKLQEQFHLSHLIFLILISPLLWGLNALRHYIFIFLIYAIIFSFLVNISKQSYKRNLLYALSFFIFLCIVPPSPRVNLRAGILSSIPMSVRSFLTKTSKPDLDIYKDLEYLSQRHKGLAIGNSTIAPEVDISTPLKALKFLPKGMAYFLFAPFPWRAEGLLQKATIPENILLFIIFPFVLYGMYINRTRWRMSFVIIFFVMITLVAYSLVEGNIGTAYRHKAVLLPFFFIFASAGIIRFMKRQK